MSGKYLVALKNKYAAWQIGKIKAAKRVICQTRQYCAAPIGALRTTLHNIYTNIHSAAKPIQPITVKLSIPANIPAALRRACDAAAACDS